MADEVFIVGAMASIQDSTEHVGVYVAGNRTESRWVLLTPYQARRLARQLDTAASELDRRQRCQQHEMPTHETPTHDQTP